MENETVAKVIAMGNALSLTALGSTIVGWLPHMAVLAPILWYGIQIYESKTFQKWVRRHRMKQRTRSAVVKSKRKSR